MNADYKEINNNIFENRKCPLSHVGLRGWNEFGCWGLWGCFALVGWKNEK